MLDVNGVTRDRAKYVSNGIDVFATRLARENTDLRARCEKVEKRLEYVTTNIDTVAAGQCYETQDDFYAAIDAAIAKERT